MIRLQHPMRALRRMALQRRKRGRATGLILMYHRIGPPGIDPWQLAVTPKHFAQHLDVLRRRAVPIPLTRLAEDLRERRLIPGSVALTFDDGFADNLLEAKPLLERMDVPGTVYVTTGPTGTTREFWWDMLDRAVLAPDELPEYLELAVDGRRFEWTLGKARYGAWRDGHGAGRERAAFHLEIWSMLRPLSHAARESAVEQLGRWSVAAPVPRATHRVLSADEIVRLAEDNLVSIGAHTVTHPHLPSLSPTEQQTEMSDSRAALQAILNRPVTSFSYPYGAVDDQTVDLTRSIGFSEATAVHEQTVWDEDNLYRLPRFAVRDWDGDEFERRLTRWFRQHVERT